MSTDYVLTYGMKEQGKWGTMKGAVKRLYFMLKEEKSPIGEQFLSTIWIERPGCQFPVFINDIIKAAHDGNWVVDGKWVGG